jgi:hypothetical protein
VGVRFIRFIYGTNSARVAAVDKHLRLQFFRWLHPSRPVPWKGMMDKVYATEVRVCDDIINHIWVTVADILPGQLFSSGAQSDVTVTRVFRLREVTLRKAVVVVYCTFSPLTSPHHTNRKYSKRVL